MSMCPMCIAGLPSCCLTGSCGSTDIMLSDSQKPEATSESTKLSEPTIQATPSRIVLGIEITDDLQVNEHQSGGPSGLPEDEGYSRSDRSRSKGRRKGSNTQSAGRKVAAKLYPLTGDAPCEWQGLGNCGGGDFPILGCLEGKQEARHHGPEKNVQNNEPGNVHRICHYCHYRWHAANDPTYDWNAGLWVPHNPRPLTVKEQQKQAIDYMRYLTTGRRGKLLKEQD
jgi:hypothetical protein